MHAMRDEDAPDSEDWLSPREIADALRVPLRTVQASFADDELRIRWWEPEVDGRRVKAWRTKPLTRQRQYQARRWAVDRLVGGEPVGA
jgi:hypothetical protein